MAKNNQHEHNGRNNQPPFIDMDTNVADLKEFLEENEEEYHFKRVLVSKILCHAQAYLRGVKRPIGRMRLVYTDLMESMIAPGEAISFVLQSDTGYSLYLYCNFKESYYNITAALAHKLKHGSERYEPETQEWILEPENWMEEVFKKEDTAKSALLGYLIKNRIFLSNSNDAESREKFEGLCRTHQPLLELYERMESLLCFAVIQNPHSVFEIVLAPDDPYADGLLVGYEDGYKIMQYLSHEDYEDCWLGATGKENCVITKQLLKTVTKEKDIEKVAAFVKRSLDHYWGCDQIYIFPLSMGAYVASRNPFTSLPVRILEDRMVTDKEKSVLMQDNFFFRADGTSPVISYRTE